MKVDFREEDDDYKGSIRAYRTNPAYDLYKRKLTRLKKKKDIFETTDGEVRKGSYNEVMDKRVLGKIDVDDPMFFERWNKLSSSAMTMLMFIMHKLSNGGDKVQLLSNEFKLKTGMDTSSFYKARTLLVNEGWISYTELPKTYWVNYSRIGKGNTLGPYHTEEQNRVMEHIFNKTIAR